MTPAAERQWFDFWVYGIDFIRVIDIDLQCSMIVSVLVYHEFTFIRWVSCWGCFVYSTITINVDKRNERRV